MEGCRGTVLISRSGHPCIHESGDRSRGATRLMGLSPLLKLMEGEVEIEASIWNVSWNGLVTCTMLF